MDSVPKRLIEFFLLGRASPDDRLRFTQDAGIVTDVWLSFAKDLAAPNRILLQPLDGLPAIEAAAVLHHVLHRYRTEGSAFATENAQSDPLSRGIPANRVRANVAPLENFVAATLYFDELIRVVLPLTAWYHGKALNLLNHPDKGTAAGEALQKAVAVRLTSVSDAVRQRAESLDLSEGVSIRKLLEAAPIAGLIGVFAAGAAEPGLAETLEQTTTDRDGFIRQWVSDHADEIAQAAVSELRRAIESAIPNGQALVERLFLNRESYLADTEALGTVKADAADRVFRISCKSLTWAIIDSGIAASHPAFDEFKTLPDGTVVRARRSRVKAAYDLTLIDRIRNFDLTIADKIVQEAVIEDIIRALMALPGKRPDEFKKTAGEKLKLIAEQLARGLMPDWALVEPLIRILHDDGMDLTSDHGTHVAGILGGDWRRPTGESQPSVADDVILQGICPDISLYDLRVIHPHGDIKNTEFAVIAALEFVRYLNSRAAGPPIIHGVNISLSIPHEVRNYGCGATPICMACDELVQSGVVVVAAAGNRGWNEQETGFGNFVFCSITDPGNAQNVITVGATHRLKPHAYGVSYFSSRGPTGDGRVKPDLVAPGEKIRGPIRGDSDDQLDGTSMAAPFVSGAAAMLMARHRELIRQPLRIKTILCNSATDLGRERYFQGHGLVDVLRALQST